MRFAKSLIAALLCAGVGPAFAQKDGYGYAYQPDGDSGLSGFAGLRGSLAFSGNTHTNVPTAPPTALRASYNTGGGGSIYVGTRLPLGLRLEGEALWRYLPITGASVGGAGSTAHGQAQLGGPMVNLLWDVPVPDFPFRPFLGGGVGAMYTALDVRDPTNANTYLSANNWNLAYQFIGGAELPLSQSSRVTAMYRWLDVSGVGEKCGTSGPTSLACKSNISSQSVDLGLEMDL